MIYNSLSCKIYYLFLKVDEARLKTRLRVSKVLKTSAYLLEVLMLYKRRVYIFWFQIQILIRFKGLHIRFRFFVSLNEEVFKFVISGFKNYK